MIARITPARALAVLAAAVFVAPAAAQTYPEKPIRFIIPFAPGGTSDIVGRLLSTKMTQELGQTVVIDNRGGGGSTVGTALAAKSPPDGYTIIINHLSLAINQSLYPKLASDAARDLTPVSRVGDTQNVVVVTNTLPVKSMKELLALARREPDKLDYGSGGIGSGGHLPVALLQEMTKLRFNHIPYKGGGPSVTATMTGEVQFAIPTIPTAVPLIRQQRVRALAVTGAQRSNAFPELPTIAEAGVPGYDFALWYGVFAPAGTPRAAVTRLNQVLADVLRAPEMQKQMAQQGIEVQTSTPEALGEKLRADISKWQKIVKSAGLKPE